MSKDSSYRLWVIYNHESRPVAMATAKTEGGAKKKWETRTGKNRSEIYAEEAVFEKGFLNFPTLE